MCEKFVPGLHEFTFSLTSRAPARVLVCVPHDGARELDFDPFLAARLRGGPTTNAMGTWPIARDIAIAAGANAVRGLLPRRFIDYDAPTANAFESPQLAKSYEHYHGLLFERVRQMTQAFGPEGVLVINVRALARQPAYAGRADGYDLILSSGNRATIRAGSEPDRALEAHLSARSYNVFSADNSRHTKLFDRLSPDFTCAQLSREFGVSAFTLEIARRFRTRDAAVAGTRLSSDIAAFIATLT